MPTSVIEPYNAVLATHYAVDLSDCTFMLENEGLYRLFRRTARIYSPGHKNINEIISQAVSCVTASHRFSGCQNISLTELAANIVPYPRVHFPVISYAAVDTPRGDSIHETTKRCFRPSNHLIACDPRIEKYIAICMLYRGDVTPADVNKTISAIKAKRRLEFVSWCPTGFKVGINSRRPVPLTMLRRDMAGKTRALCMLSNTTAIHDALNDLLTNFDLMYSKRAFMHYYVYEDMNVDLFKQAREKIIDLMKEYHIHLLDHSGEEGDW